MRYATISILIATLALIGACRNAGSVSDNNESVPASERPLLEHEYINHAWGYSHFGVVITADGKVYGYQWERGDAASAPIEGPLVAHATLAAKYARGRTSLGSVNADTLALIEELIPKSGKGKLTDRHAVGADMGQHEYIAYVFDPRSQQYRKITLRVTGDWEWSNTSPEAQRLADIMNAVTQRSR